MLKKSHLAYAVFLLGILPGLFVVQNVKAAPDLAITFLQRPVGEVENPVTWELYSTQALDYYQIKGEVNGHKYPSSWTSLGARPDNHNPARPGYLKMANIEYYEGYENSVQFRACLESQLGNICGTPSEDITWNVKSEEGGENPQIRFLSAEDENSSDSYYFIEGDEAKVKVASTNLNFTVFVLPSSGAKIEDGDIEIIRIDGEIPQGGNLPFSVEAGGDTAGYWSTWHTNSAITCSYSITVRATDSEGKTAEKTAYLDYYPPVHLEIKTHTGDQMEDLKIGDLGALTKKQAKVEYEQNDPPVEVSTTNYDITLGATAAQGLMATYYLEGKTVISRIDPAPVITGRSTIVEGVFGIPDQGESYRIEWEGRIKLPTECTVANDCRIEAETGEGDFLELHLDDMYNPVISVSNTSGETTYEELLSSDLKAGEWYGIKVVYEGNKAPLYVGNDDELLLTVLSGPTNSLPLAVLGETGGPQVLGTAVLGAGEYIDSHVFEINFSPEQLFPSSGVTQTNTVTVTEAGSDEEHSVEVFVDPPTEELVTPEGEPVEEHKNVRQKLRFVLEGSTDRDLNKVEFPTTIKVGEELQLSFKMDAARAYLYSEINPLVTNPSYIYYDPNFLDEGDTHLEMQSLVSADGSYLPIDKNFKAAPNTGLKVFYDDEDDYVYYELMVGPQLDSIVQHCKKSGLVEDECDEDYIQTSYRNPFSVRPRSLLGVDIPPLFVKKKFITGEGTFFHDFKAQYGDPEFTQLYQIRDNNGEIPQNAVLRIRPAKVDGENTEDLDAIRTYLAEIPEEILSLEDRNYLISSVLESTDFLTKLKNRDLAVLITNNLNLDTEFLDFFGFKYPALEEGQVYPSAGLYTISSALALWTPPPDGYSINLPAGEEYDPAPFPHINSPLPGIENLNFVGQSGQSDAIFAVTEGGALAFGLNNDNSQVACYGWNCAKLFMTAELVVAEGTPEEQSVDLGLFVINFALEADTPASEANEQNNPSQGSHVELVVE